MDTAEHREKTLLQISTDLVDKFVNFCSDDDVKSSEDDVFQYAKGLRMFLSGIQ